MYQSATQAPIETKNPRVNLLVSKWQQVWLLALDRRRKLNDALDRLEEVNMFCGVASFHQELHRMLKCLNVQHPGAHVDTILTTGTMH